MARTGWFKGPVCGVDNCRSRRYRTSDGLTICQYGHVMEGNIEIDDDQDQASVPTRRLNTVVLDERGGMASGVASQASSVKKNQRLYGKEARKLYYRCLQVLLRRQYENMARLYFPESMHDDLLHLVKINWIKVISHFMGQKSDNAQDSDNEDGEESGSDSEDKKRLTFNQVRALDLVAIIYISMLQLRFYPLYSDEIIAGLKSNQIPFIRCLHLVPKVMLDKLPMSYHPMLQPHYLPITGRWYEVVGTNMVRIAPQQKIVSIPTNFYYPYTFRLLCETLVVPNCVDLFCAVTTLNELIGRGAQMELSYFYGPRRFPELQLAGLIMFVVQANFKYRIFGKTVDSRVWLEHLNAYDANGEYTYLHSNNKQLLDWSDDKVHKYCDWIYDHIIPKKKQTYTTSVPRPAVEPVEELTVMEKRLLQIFNIDSDDDLGTDARAESPTPPSINEFLERMVTATTPPKSSDAATIEAEVHEKLRSKLCDTLGVPPAVLERNYNDAERRIRKLLPIIKPKNSVT